MVLFALVIGLFANAPAVPVCFAAERQPELFLLFLSKTVYKSFKFSPQHTYA